MPELPSAPPLHACASLEARANLLDGSSGATSCAALSLADCARFYVSDAARVTFHRCEPLHSLDELAANAYQPCVQGAPLACGVDAGLERARALRRSLALRVAALRNRSASVVLEEAAVATGEIFETAIAADARLSRAQLAAMLNYQLFSRGAERTGWADDAAVSIDQLAGHVVLAQLAGLEAVLHDAIRTADERLRRLADAPRAAAGWEGQRADVRGAVAVSYTHLTLPTICSV